MGKYLNKVGETRDIDLVGSQNSDGRMNLTPEPNGFVKGSRTIHNFYLQFLPFLSHFSTLGERSRNFSLNYR